MVASYYALCRAAAQAGTPKRPAATAHEFADLLAHRVPQARHAIVQVADAFAGTIYGGRVPEAAEVEAVAAASDYAIAAIRRPKPEAPEASDGGRRAG